MKTPPPATPPHQPPAVAGVQRRWLLPGLAAASALGVGAGWWAWQHASAPAATAKTDIARLLGAQKLLSPGGELLDTRAWLGRPLLLNFWATWCPPCVQEMPELDRFARARAASGWLVVGVAIDQAAAVRSFLQQHPVSFPVAVAGTEGLALVRALGNTVGGLPYSVMLSAQGQRIQHKAGASHFDELSRWADSV